MEILVRGLLNIYVQCVSGLAGRCHAFKTTLSVRPDNFLFLSEPSCHLVIITGPVVASFNLKARNWVSPTLPMEWDLGGVRQKSCMSSLYLLIQEQPHMYPAFDLGSVK